MQLPLQQKLDNCLIPGCPGYLFKPLEGLLFSFCIKAFLADIPVIVFGLT